MHESIQTEILASHADHLVEGEDATQSYLHLFPEADAELAQLMTLAGRVRAVLRPVRPTPTFRAALRRDLLAAARQRAADAPRPRPPFLLRPPFLPPYTGGQRGDMGQRGDALEAWRTDAELWVDYARRRLPDFTPPLWVERRQPPPRGLVLAALLASAGALAYWRRRREE